MVVILQNHITRRHETAQVPTPGTRPSLLLVWSEDTNAIAVGKSIRVFAMQ